MSSQDYYKLKVRPIYRTYPVYAAGREPAGYFESLLQKEPEIVFDASKLRTKEDWIRAGQLVFEDGTVPQPAPPGPLLLPPALQIHTSRDGVIPYLRYVIRKKGVLEFGVATSCAACHTRVLDDGTVLEGAQGDFPVDQIGAALDGAAAQSRWAFFGAPWVMPREEYERASTAEEYIRRHSAIQPGVMARHCTSDSPAKVPSLIGLEDIKFLDSTGLMRHRSIGDLMRYAAANYGLDIIAHYGDFQPQPVMNGFAEDRTSSFPEGESWITLHAIPEPARESELPLALPRSERRLPQPPMADNGPSLHRCRLCGCPLERRPHIAGAREALLWILSQTRSNQAFEPYRLNRDPLLRGPDTARHLVQRQPESVNICARISLLAFQLLRRHVRRRAHHSICHR